MRVTLHPAAEQDMADAAAFYALEGSPALARRFVEQVNRVAQLLLNNPGMGTPRGQGRRGFPIAGFPYTLVYRPVPTGVLLLVVKHDRRSPRFGRGR